MTSKAIKRRKKQLNSRVIREHDQRSKWDFLFFFLICILISIPVLLFLMKQIEYVRYEYEIKELKHQKQMLQKQQKCLDLEKATLSTPLLIEETARKELSLIGQDEGTFMVVVSFRPQDPQYEKVAQEESSDMVARKIEKR
jgi:cell division protein FtsL